VTGIPEPVDVTDLSDEHRRQADADGGRSYSW
jgi:hypothetical protein